MHHGLANAVMIEPVMAFNAQAVPDKFAELAHAVGCAGTQAFVPWLSDLKRDIGIAPSLRTLGVRPEQFDRLVEVASHDICHQTNPRPCEPADFQHFFEQAY